MRKLLTVLLVSFALSVQAQNLPFANYNAKWVDSVMANMTLDEKIGQLLMPRGNFGNTPYEHDKLLQWVSEYKVGGFVFFANQPTRQAQMVNELQALSRVPLFVGMDLEWGLSMRLDSVVRYPYAMTLGAIQGNDDQLYQMGRQIGQQCKRMGVHINYAPVADVNNNPNNPVINFRSFGENKQKVFEKALAYMRGMQDEGILTSAKHFPGHGDTDVDSHEDLPLIRHDRMRLDSVELYPFRELIKKGLNGVMIAHLNIPALDPTEHQASTLSTKIGTDLLRNELGFKGLVFSDAMEMKGVSKYYPNGEAMVRALLAGNDLLETFTDVPGVFNAIKYAVAEGRISLELLNSKVRRILIAKAWAGLDHYKPIEVSNLTSDLRPASAELLARQLQEDALTVLRNADNRIPIRELANRKVAVLSLGTPSLGNAKPTAFQQMAANYTTVDFLNVLPSSPATLVDSVKNALSQYDVVLVGVHGLGIRPAARLDSTVVKMVNKFSGLDNAIYVLFGNPYTFNRFSGFENTKGLIVTYQETVPAQELAAELIFGAVGAKGKLPVTANANFKFGDGIETPSLGRFKYTLPEEVGIDSKYLTARLDSIVNQGLAAKAYPGAQVLVAKNGKVIYQKTFGYQTYDKTRPVKPTDVYDLASVTKVSTSAAALMKMEDEGKFNLDMKLKKLMKKWKRSNKANLVMRDILTHQARLRAWIPFWKELAQNPDGKWKPETFQDHYSDDYPVQVAEKLFLHKNYDQKMFDAIRDSPLNEKPGYVYSDMSYYLYPQIIKRLTKKDFQTFLKDTFYKSLGANSLTFNAGKVMSLDNIVPTEYDSLFRKELIHGRVHDEGATMLDGISGHAGLFGNANDLAKLFQMYLNGGEYGGKRYLNESTLNEWTSYGYPVEINSRRGIAFDKPDRKRPGLSAAPSASEQSFGHSGFTGTFVWADPRDQLLYVFLSNRVYPTRNNGKISELNIRTQFGEMIYQSIKKGLQ
ncbi:MAG: glycoside hydrolase family 3 N-terminal domain-containing protein [Spirosomataceae bacterium]